MNVRRISAYIRVYIKYSSDSEIPALERELLANGCSKSQLSIIRKAKKSFDEWCNLKSEYDFDSINSKANSMIEKVVGRMLILPSRGKEAKIKAYPLLKTVLASPACNNKLETKTSKVKYDCGAKVKFLSDSTTSSIGKFIVDKVRNNPDITCDKLANVIVNEFVTKTGIIPDKKYAVRHIKLFIEKGLIKVE